MERQLDLFAPTEHAADPDCAMCGGAGVWRWYRHGADPASYPLVACACTRPKRAPIPGQVDIFGGVVDEGRNEL